MIFIHTRPTDGTTLEIIRWLIRNKKTFFRLDTLSDVVTWEDEIRLMYGIEQAKEKPDISVYFNGKSNFVPAVNKKDLVFSNQFSTYLQEQAETLIDYVLSTFAYTKSFGLSPFSSTKLNKIKVLELATNIGFTIPPTTIISSKQKLFEIVKKWGRIITKSLDNGINIDTEKILLNGQRTEEVTMEIIESMADNFFPSMIQKLIEKQFEIRVFFFRDKFYSIAIFSQRDPGSMIDSRFSNTTRQVPFLLPQDMQEKISKLMGELKLNYGSLDFIYTTNDEFCFLEVNPFGQYGFLSKAGNYYIEKEIAEYL